MRLAAVTAALLAVPLIAPTAASAQLARPKIDTVGGHVVRVMNPGPTAWTDTNGWKLVLERTIQPKDGEPGELANPFTVLRTSTGQYIVGDLQPSTITLFGQDGRFLRTLGRRGEGPGEFRVALIGLFRDTLLIQDTKLHRVTLMTLDGKAVRSFPAKSYSCCDDVAVDASGRIRIPTYFAAAGRSAAAWWMFYSTTGRLLDSLRPPETATTTQWKFSSAGGFGMQSIPFAAYNTQRVLKNGNLLVGFNGVYQLFELRRSGDTVRIFGRAGVAANPIPTELRDSLFKLISGSNPGLREVAKLSDVPKQYPFWSSVHEDGSGNVWVLTDGRYEGPHQFDVFSHDGRFLGTVPLPFTKGAIRVLGDRIGVIDTDDNDLPRIRIYRIDRRGK